MIFQKQKMVELYFGLPGTGKTTLLASMAKKASRGKWRNRKYKYIYTNVHLTGLGEKIRYIDPENLGVVDVRDSLVLIDEGSIYFDNRDYKRLSKNFKEFLFLHRHYGVDIVIFTQQYNAVDVKIRLMCTGVYYMWRPVIVGKWITRYYRVPYGIAFPDRRLTKKATGVPYGDIVEGYCRPNIIQRIMASTIIRPLYYRHFDSYAAPPLTPYEKIY